MSIFKCKMCGGALEIQQGQQVAQCEYCGSMQTLPRLDTEGRVNLYDRANYFRRVNEFDKASEIYEQILREDMTDAEAYWSLVLCRYGIEYVEDPMTKRRVPTVQRTQYTSIYDDENYVSAIKYADIYRRAVYEDEARVINELQKEILAISENEEPFDVFICYKETDDSGRRTRDSVMAQELYYLLKNEGFKVFFSRITLEDKLGTAYEPYIFAALNSAKVMVVLGTRAEHFDAVWVRNEWSRYLALIRSGKKKMLIPAYRDMDPYDLPTEFSHLQAQDMSRLGFMQDLTHVIKKVVNRDKKPQAPIVHEKIIVSGEPHDYAPLLRRAYLFLEDGEFDSADEYAEKVLDMNPECAEAYVAKLLSQLKLKKEEDLSTSSVSFSEMYSYKMAQRFARGEYGEKLADYNRAVTDRIEFAKCDEVYTRATFLMEQSRYEDAAELFFSLGSFKDSLERAEECDKLREETRVNAVYANAHHLLKSARYDEAAEFFASIKEYKDSEQLITVCIETKELARKDAIYYDALDMAYRYGATIPMMQKAISMLSTISGYRDADEKIYAIGALIENTKMMEENARIKAEEERRMLERKEALACIEEQKRARRNMIIAIITAAAICTVSAIAVVLLLK